MKFYLTDERYSHDRAEFESYDQMIDALREMFKNQGLEFTKEHEEDLQFETE